MVIKSHEAKQIALDFLAEMGKAFWSHEIQSIYLSENTWFVKIKSGQKMIHVGIDGSTGIVLFYKVQVGIFLNSVDDENRFDKGVYEDLDRLRRAIDASIKPTEKEIEKLSEEIKYCRKRIDALNDNMATHEDINKLSDKLWQLIFVFLTAIISFLAGLIYFLLK